MSSTTLAELERLTRTGAVWSGFRTPAVGTAATKKAASAEVISRLQAMFHGKCAMCERPGAEQIEHFCPKSIYPERTYLWSNLLLICGDCNHNKIDLDPFNPAAVDGGAALLDPTVDTPEEHIRYDSVTGLSVFVNRQEGVRHRGEKTVIAFHLDRQALSDARHRLFVEIILLLDLLSLPQEPLAERGASFLTELIAPRSPHLAVIRQLLLDPAHQPLITAVATQWPALSARFDELRAIPARSPAHQPR
ncbi:MAG: TIGR02646 family protein [Deltaproteobacteria bacterium]|nr:TIGR02646 family protein [Deltaproteobacteria bacterium]